MKPVPFLDLKAQHATIKEEIKAAIDRVVESQHFILGPEVEALEQSVSAYSQCKYGIGVSSGTDAILVALMALGVGHGDEVVTTPYTFLATATCVARLGARAVFVDVDPRTYNIDAERVEAAITPKTKAIMPVHLFGQMTGTLAIAEIGRKHGIPVIEDAAQAIGADERGRRAGSIGALGCLSFFPSKNLGGFGDGGMVVTNDSTLADRLKPLRNHGQRPKHVSLEVGGNFRLDALQAAILSAKLPHLDDWTAKRRANAALYRTLFAQTELRVSHGDLGDDAQIALPVELRHHRHVYNQFVIRTHRRDQLREFLAKREVGSEVYYPQPMHLQKCFESWAYAKGAFPESERVALESLAIPIYPELEPAMIETVVAAVVEFLE